MIDNFVYKYKKATVNYWNKFVSAIVNPLLAFLWHLGHIYVINRYMQRWKTKYATAKRIKILKTNTK